MMKYFLKKKNRGFTLVEVIIAMVVLSLAVGTLVVVLANLLRATVLPEIVNVSTGLAEQELERVSGLRYSTIANAGPTSFGGSFSSYTYQITVSAVPVALASDAGMTQYKQVQVTVTNPSAGSVSLSTVVTNN